MIPEYDLPASPLFAENARFDCYSLKVGPSDFYGAISCLEKHLVEHDRFPSFRTEKLNQERLASLHSILFSARFDNCEHS